MGTSVCQKFGKYFPKDITIQRKKYTLLSNIVKYKYIQTGEPVFYVVSSHNALKLFVMCGYADCF